MRAITAAVAGAFVAASVVGGISSAIGTQTTFYACVHKTSGSIKMTTATKACASTYNKISWTDTGTQGPKGDIGATGPQGPKGDPGNPGMPDCSVSRVPGCLLMGANQSGKNLSGVDLTGQNLTGRNFSGADLSGANMAGAVLYYANFTNANLTGANLAGAQFCLYDPFSGYPGGIVSTTVANLTNANLSGANLKGSRLSCAYAAGLIITGADLAGAT